MNIDKPELIIPKELYESKQAPRQKAKDNLSNDTVKFKPVSVSFVLQFWKDVREGKYAPNTVLYTLSEDVQGFTAGTTGERVGEVVKDVITLKVPYATTMVKTNMSKVQVKNREDWTTTDVVEFAILPWMLEHNKCVVDVISPEFVGASFQGAFVSQARSCRFDDLLSAVTNHFLAKQPMGQPGMSKKPKGKADTKKSGNIFGRMRGKTRAASFAQENKTRKGSNASTMSQANQTSDYLSSCYIWLDIFSANQPHLCRAHPDASIQQNRYSVLTHGLHHAIDNFDERLIFFDDFQKPVVISRAWCIWEIFGIAKENLSLEVICTSQVMLSLKQKFTSGNLNVLYLFSELNPKDMTCHSPEDFKMIFEAVESLPGGFTRLKQVVTDKMSRWFLSFIDRTRLARVAELKSSRKAETSEDADFLFQAGGFLVGASKSALARWYFHSAFDLYMLLKMRRQAAICQCKLGAVYSSLDMKEYAVGFCSLAKLYFEMVSPTQGSLEDKLELARVYATYAGAVFGTKNNEESLVNYNKALELFLEVNNGEYNAEMAEIIGFKAIIYCLRNDRKKGLELQLEAIQILEKVFGKNHIELASKYFNLGGTFMENKDFENALKFKQMGLRTWQEVLGEDCHKTANGHYAMGVILNEMERLTEAEAELKIALNYYYTFVPEAVVIPDIQIKLATVFLKQNNLKASKAEFKKAYEICVARLGENDPKTMSLAKTLSFLPE